MKIYIQNDDPCWVRYGLLVEATPERIRELGFNPSSEDGLHDFMLDRLQAGDFEVASGPEVQDTVSGMDQEYEITEIQRDD